MKKKLVLKKEVIAKFDNDQMRNVKGGYDTFTCTRPVWTEQAHLCIIDSTPDPTGTTPDPTGTTPGPTEAGETCWLVQVGCGPTVEPTYGGGYECLGHTMIINTCY